MTGIKSALASKTIWGALVAILPQLLALFGVTLTPADAAQLGAYVNEILAIIGGLIAIYGRVRATKVIRSVK